MKKIKRIISLFTVFMMPVLNGCVSYTELNEKYFVSGAALDYDEDHNNYLLTVEVIEPNPSSEGSNLLSRTYSAKGSTVFDAVRNVIKISGKKLYWSHAKVLIINENVLHEDIRKVIDFFDRDPEVRSDMWILVSDKQAAGDVLRMKEDNTMLNGFNISTMIKNSNDLPKYVKEDLWDFMHELTTPGYAPVASIVNLARNDSKLSPEIEGTAVFSKSKMVGKLNDLESIALLFIRNKIKGGLLVIPSPDSGTDSRLVLEIFHSSTKTTAIVSGNSVTVDLVIKAKVGIGEAQSTLNFTVPKTVDDIEKHCEKYIKDLVSSVITKVQQEYKSDIFGFGTAVSIHTPMNWKRMKDNWEENFSTLHSNVTVEVELTGTGETTRTSM